MWHCAGEKTHKEIWYGKPRKRKYLKDPAVDGKIILE
jgi:hypothetical protein